MYRWNRHCDADPGYRDYPHMGQVLRYYRELCGYTQDDLGDLVGVSGTTVSEWETLGCCDSVSHLRKLAELLDIPWNLLGLAGTEPDDLNGVVREYRVRKGWTKAQLAKALAVSGGLVYQIEDRSTSLDLLSRRRALQFILNIPPALLGLDALYLAPRPLTEPVLPSFSALQSAQEKLWSGYYVLHGQDELETVSRSLLQLTGPAFMQLKGAFDALSEKDRSLYLAQLSLLYQSVANIVLSTADKGLVLRYNNHAVRLARFSEDPDALAVALNRRAAAWLELGEIEPAEESIRESLAVVSSPNALATCVTVAARVYSVLATDEKDRTRARSFVDSFRVVVYNDPYNVRLDENILTVCRGRVLVNLAQNAPNRSQLLRQAVSLLEQAENLAPEFPRRLLLIKIAQAQAYLGLQEYEQAADLAVEGFQLMQQIKSVLCLPQFLEIYQMLLQSKAAASPQVARLGLLLFHMGTLEDGKDR